ncbi:MAG: matrixin family metalloprotease [Nitrosarchaeum sp.]|nr:MAG: matrixin family metalloprotease [Nitrosarchaeum sp.]
MKSELVFDLESQRVLLQDMNLRLKQSVQIERQTLQKSDLQRYSQESNSTYQKCNIISGKRKRLTVLGILIIAPILVSVFSSDLNSNLVTDDVMKSGYVIQNLKGDTIDTFHSWDIPKERTLYVNIVNPNVIDSDKVQIIKDAILSEKTISLDDSLFHKALPGSQSTYFLGWSGALKQASQTATKFTIPTSFSINDGSTNGDIAIILSTLESPDGYSGFTRSIVENNQILKSTITIYNADQLSSAELETIVRHEFGHAVGLIHSSDPSDLMHPIIETNYPFISNCDVSAITHLYDGNANDKAVCEI